jgi:acyl-CoA synthetase (AMP-forming)/AMP-acid ligase II
MPSIYEQDLDKTPANFAALSPVSFLERSADIYPDLTAVIHGQRCYNWAQIRERSARLALYRHPAVLACAVVAKPDDKWGETPLAFVELHAGHLVDAESLKAHCKSLLAAYKIPRTFVFEAIPKTSTGKIQKFQLIEKAKVL